MKNKGVFCEECRKDVEYIVSDQPMKGTIKGEVYHYIGKMACCKECNSEIYVDEINDYNLKALYDEYRKKNDIISMDEITGICSKYDIGKRPLSLLLGWGEQTFSRYCDGDIPTKQYSEVLKHISADPHFYNQILEENKKNLKTDAAYKKSKMAVEKLIGSDSDSNSKINLVIEYLLNKCEDITPLALQKTLYYVQGFYYAFYDTFLFTEDCQAWVHGPVYPDIYSKYKNYKFDSIDRVIAIDDSVFTSSEIAILNSVVKNLCCYSGKILEQFTHSESPWLSARKNLPKQEPSTEIICKEDIGTYFESVKEKYNMINPNDIESYSKTMFKQIQRN
ncbi:hypothetical protein HMPREF1635_00370 [Clostridiales bacterium S5-A14a]|nr:hypothetical protein HMPREF1635_00370 [Clostridiales bacterium S5-A14a]